jgi:hypothetical protein
MACMPITKNHLQAILLWFYNNVFDVFTISGLVQDQTRRHGDGLCCLDLASIEVNLTCTPSNSRYEYIYNIR